MKISQVFTRIALIIAIFSFVTSTTNGNSPVLYKVNGSSKLWLEGESTLHDFTCNAKKMWGYVKIAGNIFSEPDSKITDASLEIPVKYIVNEDEDLTENMHESFKADEHPRIKYKLSNIEFESENGNSRKGKAKGSLTISGVTKTVYFKVILKKSDNSINLSGDTRINMSDFGIEPPTMFLGTVKTEDEVQVLFDIDLVKE